MKLSLRRTLVHSALYSAIKPGTQFTVIFLVTSLCINVTSAQKNKIDVGLTALVEATPDAKFGGGLMLSKSFSKKHNVSIAVNYRSALNNVAILVASGSNFAERWNYTMIEKYVSIALTYSYTTKILKLSAGPTIDFYTGYSEQKHWTDQHPPAMLPLNDYPVQTKTLFGAIMKLSKPISITKNQFVEPCIFYNPVFTEYEVKLQESFRQRRQFIGVSVSFFSSF